MLFFLSTQSPETFRLAVWNCHANQFQTFETRSTEKVRSTCRTFFRFLFILAHEKFRKKDWGLFWAFVRVFLETLKAKTVTQTLLKRFSTLLLRGYSNNFRWMLLRQTKCKDRQNFPSTFFSLSYPSANFNNIFEGIC